MKVNPTNLSDLYFDVSEHREEFENEFYVHSGIATSTESVCHGRGMIATQDIQAGTLLFVTPPTVYSNQIAVQKMFLENKKSSDLEGIALELLVENMWNCIEQQEIATVNSFLALMGVSNTKTEKKRVNFSTLNAMDYTSVHDLKSITKKDLENIILKNAFGPDFITYDKIAKQWNGSKALYYPPHMLGIYPLAAILNHSCSANAVRSYAGEIMIAHATKIIPAGSEIVWSYIPPTKEFTKRRTILKDRHGFVCNCERCSLESKELAMDILPLTLKNAIEHGSKWNTNLLDVANSDGSSKRQLCSTFITLEGTVLGSTSLSNEVKRYLRVGFTNLQFNYFNAILSNLDDANNAQKQQVREDVLNLATHLHFAFCACNNASTEHLSLLHLCYELINVLHQTCDNKSQTITKVRFWTEQLKKAHLVRYGSLGNDIECIRNALVHTRTILRQKEGFLKATYRFL